MSNHLAIANVTAGLQDLVQEAASNSVSGAVVTTQRPEAAANGAQNDPKVNIYLYQVLPNAAWLNRDIVIRRVDESAREDRARDTVEYRAHVPLNLYYLLSFYGSESEQEPQRLLGATVGQLQAHARLPLTLVQAAKESRSYLAASDLDFQLQHIEQVQLTPVRLDLEEMSKIWSVFFQVPYALSVAYEASVVLIEPGAPRLTPVVTDPRAAVKRSTGDFLFTFDPAFSAELDREEISDELRAVFGEHRTLLSANAEVARIEQGLRWDLRDPDPAKLHPASIRHYRIEREGDGLDLYRVTAES